MAAVIGRDFDADVLARVAELDEDTVIDGCDQAVAAALLTEADVAGRYTFAHALIEHALYDGSLCRPAGAHPPAGGGGARGALWRRSRPTGSGSSPTTGRAPPSPRTRARRSRTRNRRAIGPWRSSRPTRRCAGTEMRSICSTGPPATICAAGPCCSSGSATRNGRPVIPRTAKPCSRPVASPTTSTRSTSSCARCCGTTEGGTSIAGGVDRERIEMLELALSRLGDSDSPDRARLLALLMRRAHLGRRVRRSPRRWRPKPSTWRGAPATPRRWWTRSGSATRRSRCPRPSPLRLRWNREACALADDARRPDRSPARQRLPVPGGAGGRRPRDHADPTGDPPRRKPSGSDNRSTGGSSHTTTRWTGCSTATSTPRSRPRPKP